MTKVLALTVRPIEGPDTRYRILQYIPFLRQAGFDIHHESLLSSDFYLKQQKKQLRIADVFVYLGSVCGRLRTLLSCAKYDVIWVSRELMPIGPPLMEMLLFTRSSCKIVYDFDDALFLKDQLGGFVHRYFRDFKKFEYIAPRCSEIVCGNTFLADYYRQFSNHIHIIPTCLSYAQYASIEHTSSHSGRVRIGWIGTATNRGHLDMVRHAIEYLATKYDIEFITVGLREPLPWNIKNQRHLPWSLENELSYFSEFDIGIMPLEESTFTRGKCAFKLIQYMAAGIPAVASPVGANCEAMTHGVHGFFAENDEAWRTSLETLICDDTLRHTMGKAGRIQVHKKYALETCWPQYAQILHNTNKQT